MINGKKTVLVVGAGASVSYGLPTGKDLKDKLLNICYDKNNSFRRAFIDEYKPRKELWEKYLKYFSEITTDAVANEFLPKLYYKLCHTNNVDEVLADVRKKDAHAGEILFDIGYSLIASVILENENEFRELGLHHIQSENGGIETRESWLLELQNIIGRDIDAFIQENDLTIITFNYDRLIELSLKEFCKHRQFQGDYDKLVEHLKIYHVHGGLPSLGEWPIGNTRFEHQTEGQPMYIEEKIKFIQGTIRCPFLDTKIDKPWIHEIYNNESKDADRLLFMGFGFDQTNMKHLFLQGVETRPAQNLLPTSTVFCVFMFFSFTKLNVYRGVIFYSFCSA